MNGEKKKKNLRVTEKKTSLKIEINQWPTNESNRIFSSWHHKRHLWWETLRPCWSRDDCTKTNCTNLHHVSSQHILKMMLKHSQWLFLTYLRKLWIARYNYWPEIGGAIRSYTKIILTCTWNSFFCKYLCIFSYRSCAGVCSLFQRVKNIMLHST